MHTQELWRIGTSRRRSFAPAFVYRHSYLHGRTAHEARPDEHGRVDRKPSSLSLIMYLWNSRARIPTQYSIQGLSGKHILKLAVEDLLPHSIVYRQKMGFPTPWAYWLAGPQLDDLETFLSEPRTLERGLIERDAIRSLFAEHRAGHRDNGDRIWRLLNLEIWQRVFLDGELPIPKSISPPMAAVTDSQSRNS